MSAAIDIFRGTNLVATINPDSTSSLTKKIMGDNIVSLSFEMNRLVNFNIGDYAVVFGEHYFVNSIPSVTKKSKYNYDYNLIVQSYIYDLSKAQYLFLGDDNTLKQGEFSLMGTADTFIDLIISNINRVEGGWKKGGVIQTGYKNITFSQDDCLTALQKIAKEFDTEYFTEGTTIHLAKKQTQTGQEFKYGYSQGLYEITRTQLDSTSIITRLYPYGGTVNIPSDYRNYSQRLLLPNIPEQHLISNLTITALDIPFNNTKTFIFYWTKPLSAEVTNVIINYKLSSSSTWLQNTAGPGSPRLINGLPTGEYNFYFTSVTASAGLFHTDVITVNSSIVSPIFTGAINYFLEKNTSKYGTIESTLILDDIYPHRTGTVTSVDATNQYKFLDTTIDFNLNEYLLPGLTAKVTFNTGQLSGYTFDISSFDVNTSEFTILKNKDEKALDIPSFDIRMNIGDKYVLTDIRMPQSYVDAAELELLKQATEYLNKNSEPQYNYTIVCDPKHFRKNNIKLDIGDIVRITDIELQLQKNIRIIGLTKSLLDEFEYTLELGETVTQSTLSVIRSNQASTAQDVRQVNNTINNNSLLAGTYIGLFTIKQGTIIIEDIETASDVSNMKPLYIDATGKIWKSS